MNFRLNAALCPEPKQGVICVLICESCHPCPQPHLRHFKPYINTRAIYEQTKLCEKTANKETHLFALLGLRR